MAPITSPEMAMGYVRISLSTKRGATADSREKTVGIDSRAPSDTGSWASTIAATFHWGLEAQEL